MGKSQNRCVSAQHNKSCPPYEATTRHNRQGRDTTTTNNGCHPPMVQNSVVEAIGPHATSNPPSENIIRIVSQGRGLPNGFQNCWHNTLINTFYCTCVWDKVKAIFPLYKNAEKYIAGHSISVSTAQANLVEIVQAHNYRYCLNALHGPQENSTFGYCDCTIDPTEFMFNEFGWGTVFKSLFKSGGFEI